MLKIIDSKTALFVTFFRAIANQSPKNHILKDPFAERFLPWFLQGPIKSKRFTRAAERLIKHNKVGNNVLIRARYAEDQLEKRLKKGVKQYVILGAGWDSFSLRRPDIVKDINVYELDFPATQKRKIEKLNELGIPLADNIHYTPIDFETTSISDALSQSSFDPNLPTFVTWQGVTYYLSLDAIEGVLNNLDAYCKGDLDIVLDYVDERYFDTWKDSYQTRLLHSLVSIVGEPFKTGFSPTAFPDWLDGHGYGLKEDLNIKNQIQYFGEENMQTFRPSRGVHLAHVYRKH